MEKNAYHHGDLRQSLIEGAIALIHQSSISDLSLRQVARRVGVSHNAPYRHFENKEALLAAVAQQGFQSLRLALEAARQTIPPNSSQRLEGIGVAYIEFALANPAYYRVMFGEYHNNLTPYPELAETAQQAFKVLVDTISEGQIAGIFRPADPIDLARVAWSFVHGQAMLILDNQLQIQSGEELDTFLKFSSKIMFEGLGEFQQ